MAYKFGKRGGIYRIQNGKKVYLRKKTSKSEKKKNNFGLFIQPYIKNISSKKKKKVIENLITTLKKIESKTGRKVILDYNELLPAVIQASKILQISKQCEKRNQKQLQTGFGGSRTISFGFETQESRGGPWGISAGSLGERKRSR